MSETYFSKFNTITYANSAAVDITERVVVLSKSKSNPYIYYPSDITNGQRPDQIAYANYGDPYTSWVLYLSNDIVDPYYEWYLDDYQFNQFVKDKYGSTQAATSKVSYYRNNWIDQSNITVAAYNALTENQKPYWNQNYDGYGRVLDYSRKKLDLVVNTNNILKLTVNNAVGTFAQDEIVTIKYTPTSNGSAQIVQSNSTVVMIQHIFNDAFPHDAITINANSYVTGAQSNAIANITACSIVSNNLPSDVVAYYTPVYYIDVENEKNEGNKVIRVMQPSLAPQFIKNTTDLLGL